MKKIFAFAIVAIMLLAIPAAAANYKLSGKFTAGYSYANETGTDNIGLSLAFKFDEAGLMEAYLPIFSIASGFATDGWWATFKTPPLSLVVSDNNDTYGWAGLEETFSLNALSNDGNRYSKVWGDISPNLSYAAQVVMDDTTDSLAVAAEGDDYKISAQVVAGLPLGLTLTSDFGWLYEDAGYYMGLSTSLTGDIPVLGGTFQVAVGNFADLDMMLIPTLLFWNADDLWAFAAYAGVRGIGLGPVTIDEVSYKMSMDGVADELLDWDTPSFYTLDLQEVTTNATAKFGPVTLKFKNAVWFESFVLAGGNNANLDVAVKLGDLELGLNADSKLNWQGPLAHGEKLELRASYTSALIGKLAGKVGYNSNWDGVLQYSVDPTKYVDMVYGSVAYTGPSSLPLYLEASGSYNQAGTNTAKAGLYVKYENTYTTVPYVVDLKALVAGSFSYKWMEFAPIHTIDAIGMLKLDSTINGQWSAGLLFISRNVASITTAAVPSFEPIASVYATYKATDMVTVKGYVTYRYAPAGVASTMPLHNVYAKLQGDIKISANATANVYWGNSGLKSVASTHADYAKPWGPYFNTVGQMYWDTFGAGVTIVF